MSPEQISILTSVISAVKLVSGWPFALFFAILVIGPWMLAMMMTYTTRKRFEAVVHMYERNLELVKHYEKLAEDLRSVVMINTQAFSTLGEAIKTNQFCPIVRQKGGTG